MGNILTGLSSKTPNNLQLGEGVFIKNGYSGTLVEEDIISATRGGATIAITPIWRNRDIDGSFENVKELKVLEYWTVQATFVAMEVSVDTFLTALGCSDNTAGVISLRHIVKTTDFKDIYWIGTLSDTGKKIQITFKNALGTGGLQLKTASRNEGELSVTLDGHYSIADLDTPPVEIQFITEDLPQVETPVADPVGGTYETAQSVELETATEGASIYYTTDDEIANENIETQGNLYSGAIEINESVTLRAIAVRTNYLNSAVLTAVYVIGE